MSGNEQRLIFVAYQGKRDGVADNIVDAMRNGIRQFNQHQKQFVARSWEEFKESGAINKQVLEGISSCEVFACDLTYFNHNVLFELGYAISLRKKILVFLDETVEDAKRKYSEFLLRIIKYTPLKNSQDVLKAFQQHLFKEDLLRDFINTENVEKNRQAIFYIQSKVQNEASVLLTDTIDELKKGKSWSVANDNVVEVEYKPLQWYLQNILKSKCVLIHFLSSATKGAFDENAKNSFFAGLACGFGKHVILAAPSVYKAPLDYDDILIQYETADELALNIEELLLKANFDDIAPVAVDEDSLNLIKLGIGVENAEDDQEGLLSYFVETASYSIARSQKKSIIVGRKGSGKSALYIKLLQEFTEDHTCFVINLRPEPEDLLDDTEMADLYKAAAKRSFFVSIWKLVIFSRLSQAIWVNIEAKGEMYQLAEHELALKKFLDDHRGRFDLNFYGVVKSVWRDSGGTLLNPEILEQVYDKFLNPLRDVLKKYIGASRTKYLKIVILADNLDKTWNPDQNLEIQSQMILSLLEIEAKVQSEICPDKDHAVNLKKVIFLRKDIFEYILRKAPESDKLTTMSHEISWEQYPNLLRDLLERRFQVVLDLKNPDDAKKVWSKYFSFKDKREPFQVIEEVVTKRPRDVIYLTNRLFESAVNNGHLKVDDQDLEYAIESYTTFLNENLIAEMRAEYPDIMEVLACLQKYHGRQMEYAEFEQLLNPLGYDRGKVDALVETLLTKRYLVGFDKQRNTPFSDLETLRSEMKKKRFFFFRNKVYLIAHAKYWFIKNKKYFAF